jgi:hypothetical protein
VVPKKLFNQDYGLRLTADPNGAVAQGLRIIVCGPAKVLPPHNIRDHREGAARSPDHSARYAMHINSHYAPAQFGNGSRPDHAANASGRGPQFQPATVETDPATTTTDTTTAAAAAEETTESNIPGKSVAHQARVQLAQFAELGGQSFGWLVSQIARETFDASAYVTPDESTEGESTDSAVAGSEETAAAGEEDTTTSTDETAAASEDGTTTITDETADPVVDPEIDPVVDLVDDLVDDLLEENEDDTEVT